MRCFFLVLVILVASCAGAVTPASESKTSKDAGVSAPLPDDYFTSTRACWKEWDTLLGEWVKNGGGVKGSINDTRDQISRDKTSSFAKMVRNIWDHQSTVNYKNYDVTILPWPIQDSLWDMVSSASLEPALSAVSSPCASLAWLGPTLWDHLIISKSYFPREMPDFIRTDPHAAGNWMVYWILIR